MKTLTQVVLPIAVVAGLVFGITFVANYSARNDKKGDGKPAQHSEPPLRFVTLVGRYDPGVPHLRAVKVAYEIGEHGHFDFWFTNARDQEVRVAFTNASCTCAGADVGIVPDEVWDDFMARVGTVGAAALLGSPAAAAAGTAEIPSLESKMQWEVLAADDKKTERKVPAARSAEQPRVGCVRLKWYGKEPAEPKRLTADLATQLPNTTASAVHLETNYLVVPPFFHGVGGSPTERSIRFGDLIARSTASRDVVCWSATRSHLTITPTPENIAGFEDCVSVSEPRPLTADERGALARAQAEAGGPPLEVKSAYRFTVTVHERREVEKNGKRVLKQLDLGPFNFQVRVAADETKPVTVPVSGVVRGDIRILGGAGESGDRIDFGESFPRSESRSKQVLLTSDIPGLDLELARSECSPDYLEPALSEESEREGRKQWRLTVKIPAGKLFDTLTDGHIVLKTKGANPRRFRIPVKASTY